MVSPDPCKKVEGFVNKVLRGIDIIIRKIVPATNLVISGINIDLMNIVKIINLGIQMFNEYVGGFVSKFNDLMRDKNQILSLLVQITSGTIVGWLILIFSPIVTYLFDLLGLDMDLVTAITYVQYFVYLMVIGNIYNLFDLLSSNYSSHKPHTTGNCNTY